MYSPYELIWLFFLLLYFFFDIILFFAIDNIDTRNNTNVFHRPLSVIIAAKNEAQNLTANLPFILNQNYPQFEVIVVNDQSQDETVKVLDGFKKHNPFLKYFNVDKDLKSSKKKALDFGIQQAKYEHLILTDADCKPQSVMWLNHLQNSFSTQHQLVIGFSPYQKQASYINSIIRFETLQTAINYFGFSQLGMTYMGVGRNLAYTKSLYKKLKGFTSHNNLLSGDDDLLVNQAAKTSHIALCIHPDSFVESLPKTNIKAWISQKRRHITTATYYQLKHQFWLGLQYLSKVLFWFLVIPLTLYLEIQNNFQFNFLGFVLLLLLIKFAFNYKIYKKFASWDLWVWSYFWELNLICLQFYIFTRNLFSTKSNW